VRRKIPLILSAALASVLLVACASASGASPEGSASATGGRQAVTVGVIPIVDVAPIYLGVQEGIFAEHGLDVTLELAQGGAAIVPAVVSGEYQFGFSNVTSLLLASAAGEPLKAVAPGNFTTGQDGVDFSAVVAPAGSEIGTAADLAGRTVAVNSLNNIGDTTVRNVVHESGGDPADVQFVEMPFPEMLPALTAGDIDAAWVVEPFLTTAVQQGAQVISSNFAQTDHDLLVAAYFTSDQTLESDPETVAAFTAAIKESLTYAQDHPDETRAVLDTYTEIDPVVKSVMVMPRFAADIEPTYLQVLADLGLEYGLFDEPVDVNKLLVPEPAQ